MQIVRIKEAQSRLPELVDSLVNGEEIVITRDDKPVAKLVASGEGAGALNSLRDLQSTSVGSVLRPLSADDDLLDELLKE
jgi:antitoxin (DNA-binding transcriptional repressor) of toxin-antitoxin stability system